MCEEGEQIKLSTMLETSRSSGDSEKGLLQLPIYSGAWSIHFKHITELSTATQCSDEGFPWNSIFQRIELRLLYCLDAFGAVQLFRTRDVPFENGTHGCCPMRTAGQISLYSFLLLNPHWEAFHSLGPPMEMRRSQESKTSLSSPRDIDKSPQKPRIKVTCQWC